MPDYFSHAARPACLSRGRRCDGLTWPTAQRIAPFIDQHPHYIDHRAGGEAPARAASSGFAAAGSQRLQKLKILLAGEVARPIQFIQKDLTENDDFGAVRDRVLAAHPVSLTEPKGREVVHPA